MTDKKLDPYFIIIGIRCKYYAIDNIYIQPTCPYLYRPKNSFICKFN